MAETFFPYDGGAGSSITEDQWRELWDPMFTAGVFRGRRNGLQVTGNGSGMQVFVNTGEAWSKGNYYLNDASITLAIDANGSSSPRIDRVVLRNDFVANTMHVVVKAGTAAVSPVPPALQQDGSAWDVPLAQVLVAAGAVSIVSGNVTDERQYAAVANFDVDADTLAGQSASYFATAAGLSTEATQRQNADNGHVSATDPHSQYATDTDLSTHAGSASGVHGVGASQVESKAGAQARVDSHSTATSGVHGVVGSNVESTAGSQAKVDAHAAASNPHPEYATDSDLSGEASTRATQDLKRPRFIGVGVGIVGGTPALSSDFQIQAGSAVISTSTGGQIHFTYPAAFPNGLLTVLLNPGDEGVDVTILPQVSSNLVTLSDLYAIVKDTAGSTVGAITFRMNYVLIGW